MKFNWENIIVVEEKSKKEKIKKWQKSLQCHIVLLKRLQRFILLMKTFK